MSTVPTCHCSVVPDVCHCESFDPIVEKHRCEIKRYGSQGNEPCVLTGIVKKVKQVYLKKALFISELTQTFLYKNVIDVIRVSVQGVKSLGGHFACLCRGFEFYEVKFFLLLFFKKKMEILLHF